MWEECEKEREGAIAKPSRQAGWLGWLAGRWGPTHRLHDAETACCAVKRLAVHVRSRPLGHALDVETCERYPP